MREAVWFRGIQSTQTAVPSWVPVPNGGFGAGSERSGHPRHLGSGSSMAMDELSPPVSSDQPRHELGSQSCPNPFQGGKEKKNGGPDLVPPKSIRIDDYREVKGELWTHCQVLMVAS